MAGGKVMLSEGTFNIRTSIKVRSGTILEGQGRNQASRNTGTILKATNDVSNTTDVINLIDANVTYVELRNFSIDGGKSARDATGNGRSGIALDWTGTTLVDTDDNPNKPHLVIEHVFVSHVRQDAIRFNLIGIRGDVVFNDVFGCYSGAWGFYMGEGNLYAVNLHT